MKPRAIAVTGLNATDNPGPGVAVIRALRAAPELAVRTIGLAYDALEPGVYAKDLVDDVFMIPYPKEGVEALSERIRYIHDRVGGLAAIIPTLDAELPSFISLEPMLAELGIGTFLPSRAQFELRSKAHLMELGRQAGINVPRARVLGDVGPLYDIHNEMPFPLVIKGPYYGATIARAVDDAVQAFQQSVAAWGLPVIAQEFVEGDEYNVVAVGDGEGGLVGAVSMRKTYFNGQGQGLGGHRREGSQPPRDDRAIHERVELARALRGRGDEGTRRSLLSDGDQPALSCLDLPECRRGDEPPRSGGPLGDGTERHPDA